jgi:hypothetical protein
MTVEYKILKDFERFPDSILRISCKVNNERSITIDIPDKIESKDFIREIKTFIKLIE